MIPRIAATLALLLALSGCGQSGPPLPKVYPVSGVVTYQGKPLEGAYVIFSSNNDKANQTAGGITDANGKYQLTTFKEKDGSIPGRMTVTIMKVDSPTEPDPKTGKIPPMKSYIPSRYSERENSGLEATVTPEGPNQFDFKLE